MVTRSVEASVEQSVDEPVVGPVRPLLRVVRGEPDDAELAALVAVVAAQLASTAPPEPPAPSSRWADPAHRSGVAAPGPDAWRTSAWGGR